MRKSRILAMALAVALTMGIMPTAAFAGTPDASTKLTTATVKGKTVSNLGTPDDTEFADAVPGQVVITTEDGAKTAGSAFATAAAEDDVKMYYYANDTALATASTATEWDDAAVADGSYIGVVVTTDSDSSKAYYVIKVRFGTPTTGDTGGSGTVDSPVLQVVVPLTLNFKVNPLEYGTLVVEGNQMTSTNFVIMNKALAPVEVSYDLEVAATNADTEVEFVASQGDVDPEDRDAAEQKIFFGYLGSTGVDTTAPTFAGTGTDGKYKYDAEQDADNATLVGFTPDSEDATKSSGKISFALAAAQDTGTPDGEADALAAGQAGIAAFQFFANLNTYAEGWEAENFTITGVYNMVGLRPATYAGYSAVAADPGNGIEARESSYAKGSMNQLISVPVADVTVAAGATVSHIVDRTGGETGYTIFLTDIPADVTKVGQIVDGTEYDIMALGFATYDDAKGVVSVTKLPSGNSAKIVITSDTAKTYTVNLTIE